MRTPVWPSSWVTPAGTSNELDVQNKWEENTQHTTQSDKDSNLDTLYHTSVELDYHMYD